MKSKTRDNILFLLLLFILCACNNLESPEAEATANNTPIVNPHLPSIIASVAPLYQRHATNTWNLKTATVIPPTPLPLDTGYYEGIIIITQYYTFLGHGLYEEAYQLLGSAARQHAPSLNEYMQTAKIWFKKIDIITIEPFYVNVKKYGGGAEPDTMNRKRFYVQIIAWGEGRLSGSRMSGELQTLFLSLIKEDGKWKIESFNTAPIP
jgi:hypothetical protein